MHMEGGVRGRRQGRATAGRVCPQLRRCRCNGATRTARTRKRARSRRRCLPRPRQRGRRRTRWSSSCRATRISARRTRARGRILVRARIYPMASGCTPIISGSPRATAAGACSRRRCRRCRPHLGAPAARATRAGVRVGMATGKGRNSRRGNYMYLRSSSNRNNHHHSPNRNRNRDRNRITHHRRGRGACRRTPRLSRRRSRGSGRRPSMRSSPTQTLCLLLQRRYSSSSPPCITSSGHSHRRPQGASRTRG